MLAAAATGRLLDAGGLLPGVHEAPVLRAAGSGWLTALLSAALLATVAARRWHRTRSLGATAAVVLPGQLVVFLSAEAVVRLVSGSRPLDPDGIVGALLQGGLAIVFLFALTVAGAVALAVSPLVLSAPHHTGLRSRRGPSPYRGRLRPALVDARGPPAAVSC